MYVERENGEFVVRRGFPLTKGMRVLMVEDIVTTGVSSRECIATIRATGAKVTAAACLIDKLPPDLAALPATKPGSRGLA